MSKTLYGITYAYYDAGAIVARVRMNKLDAMACKSAFEAIFGQVKKTHPEFSTGQARELFDEVNK